MLVRIVNPCAFNQLQVVVEGEYVIEDSKGDDAVMSGRSSAEEQVELTEESCKGRNACKAEHGNGKSDGKHGFLLGKSTQGIEGLFAVVTDNAEDKEGEVVRNRIHEQVVNDGGFCCRCRTEQGDHNVASLGNGAVGHEAAKPGLLQGAQVTDKEGGACKERDEGGDLFLNRGQGAEDENHEEGDSGCLRGHRENSGYRSGCAFVNVGGPGVEGEQGQLETDACKQEQHGNP